MSQAKSQGFFMIRNQLVYGNDLTTEFSCKQTVSRHFFKMMDSSLQTVCHYMKNRMAAGIVFKLTQTCRIKNHFLGKSGNCILAVTNSFKLLIIFLELIQTLALKKGQAQNVS